ncbi:MAG TPA: tetratricopeptide repeat protein [Candidatus Saccharimonadales bacterium]|nr:tetratricopeptide repeat protein [Candidatus Saccharimonadales bacterium]
MASDPNTPDPIGDTHFARLRARGSEASRSLAPAIPPSKPLQIFLLVAMVTTGLAYVVGEWTDLSSSQVQAKRPSKLKRLVISQGQFLDETKLGRAAEDKKQYNEAVLHYRRALQAENIAEGHYHLGVALLKQGGPSAAFAQFAEALRQNPDLAGVYSAWGQALMVQGKPEEAVGIYNRALQYNPNFGRIHYNLAEALEEQERTAAPADAQRLETQAARHYARAAALGVQSPEFWTSYGTFLNKQGKFVEAADCLNRAASQKPELGAAQFQLALAEDKLGNTGEAIAHYEATLSAMPNDPAALNSLALLYATTTNKDARSPKMAVLLATRACEATTSQNAHFVDTLARAYAADGDFLQAIASEEKAIRRASQLQEQDLLNEFNARYARFVQHKGE